MRSSIIIRNCEKSFGKYRIIDNLSLEIAPGTVYGLVGLNGAGKTTLLRLLLGILRPDKGTISVSGATPWHHAKEFYRTCGVVLENDGFWGNLSVMENCTFYATAKGISREALQTYLATYWEQSGLFKNNKKVRHLSRGQRMQCALCRAFMGNPATLFLDEPVITLDLNAYSHFKLLVKHARDNGASLIISSHQLDTIDELCDRVGILRDGTILEITRKNGNAGALWFIDTGSSDRAGEIIKNFGGNDVYFDKGYRFSLAGGTDAIPGIVRELAAAGCSIREVRRIDNDFSTAIQMFYRSSGEYRS